MFRSFIFGLFDLISAPPLSLSQAGSAIVLLCFVCFAGSFIQDSRYGMVM